MPIEGCRGAGFPRILAFSPRRDRDRHWPRLSYFLRPRIMVTEHKHNFEPNSVFIISVKTYIYLFI